MRLVLPLLNISLLMLLIINLLRLLIINQLMFLTINLLSFLIINLLIIRLFSLLITNHPMRAMSNLAILVTMNQCNQRMVTITLLVTTRDLLIISTLSSHQVETVYQLQ